MTRVSKRRWPRAICAIATALVAAGALTSASAQDYPAPGRSIRIIVPAAAGGALDMMGRVLHDVVEH